MNTKVLGYAEQNTDPDLSGLSLSDFSMTIPLLLDIKDSPLIDSSIHKYSASNHTDGVLKYVDIVYGQQNKKQRIFYDVKTFPRATQFDCEADKDLYHLEERSYCKRLFDNVVEFLPKELPTIADKDSFFRDTFIFETIENAVQSAFAIERRIDKEKNKFYNIDHYQELSESGALNSVFEVSCESDILPDKRVAHIITFKNYGRESSYHINRIKERLALGADTSSDEALLLLEEELMSEPSCTGNGGYSLFMAKKGLKNNLDADLYFKFIPLKSMIFAPGFGSYNFYVVLPVVGNSLVN